MQKDKKFVLEILKDKNVWVDASCIHKELLNDKEFILEALESRCGIFSAISKELKRDKDIVAKALKNGCRIFNNLDYEALKGIDINIMHESLKILDYKDEDELKILKNIMKIKKDELTKDDVLKLIENGIYPTEELFELLFSEELENNNWIKTIFEWADEKDIDRIPKDEFSLLELEELSIISHSFNIHIESLPLELGKLPKLKKIILNEFENIPKNLEKLKNIENIEIKGKVPKNIEKLQNIKKLKINDLSEFPIQICELKNLEELYLSLGSIKELPNEIGNLTNLKILDLSEQKIKTLPDEMSNLKKLEELKLYDNYFENIPNSIGKLSNLKILDLSLNYIEELPIELANLKNLTKLNLNGNRLKSLPNWLDDLDIQELDAKYNNLTIPKESNEDDWKEVLSKWLEEFKDSQYLPDSLDELLEKKVLELDKKVLYLPKEILYLKKLKAIDFESCRVTTIPENENVKVICIKDYKKEIPKGIEKFSDLRKLSIVNGLLDEFPKFVFDLYNLEILEIGNSKLKTIPEEIEDMTELKKLQLYGNEIEQIPDTICNMELMWLDLEGNRLENVPKCFGSLISTIRYLRLYNNKNPDLIDYEWEVDEYEYSEDEMYKDPYKDLCW